jgi:hypothetical protein
VISSQGVDQVRGRNRFAYFIPPAPAFHQIIKGQGDNGVGLEERSVFVDDSEAVSVTVGCNSNVRLVSRIFRRKPSSR